MKEISASIIILAGAILIASGAHIQHSDTNLFVQGVGLCLGFIGLWGWFVSLKKE
jgi:hypothetical protein